MKVDFATTMYDLGIFVVIWFVTSFVLAIFLAIHGRRERRAWHNRRRQIHQHLDRESVDETLCPDDGARWPRR